MFPIRHRRAPLPRITGFPRVADALRVDAAGTDVSANASNMRTMSRHRAPTFTNGGRIARIRRWLACMVGAACMLAGSTAAASDNGSRAQDLVKQVTSRITQVLDAEREAIAADPQRVYELADRLILPYFDFERMARRVLGKKRWKTATPEQQKRFVAAFRTLLVRTYAMVLYEYSGQAVTFLEPVPRKRDDEIVIPVQVEVTASQRVRVAYAMRRSGSEWKVFDVAIDGVSLVTNYRSSFRSEAARHGIEGLIARLEAKNAPTN